jgi:hypothetical protein
MEKPQPCLLALSPDLRRTVSPPGVSERHEFAPGQVVTPLAPVSAFAVDQRNLVEAANHRTGDTADAQRSGQFGPGVVVFTAVPQFEQAQPGVGPVAAIGASRRRNPRAA